MADHPAPPPDPLPALTAALSALKPNPPTVTLRTLTFNWSALDQYDEFQLFHESLNPGFHLQGVSAKPGGNGDRIKYVLNFLSTKGCREFSQWKPAGVIPDNYKTANKRVEGFLDMALNIDHSVSQWCHIFQLKGICICTEEASNDMLTTYMPLLTDATSQPMRRRNDMSHSKLFVL